MAGVMTIAQQEEPMVLIPQSEYQEYRRFMQDIRETITLLMGQAVTGGSDYMTGPQARAFLGVGQTTMWKLSSAGTFKTTGAAGRRQYETASLRTYLESQGISQEQIEQRFKDLLKSKAKK